MRENRTASLAFIPPSSDRAPKAVRGAREYTHRKRDPSLTPSVSYTTLWNPEVYRTGMGEVNTVDRPGSDEAYRLPSRGIGA